MILLKDNEEIGLGEKMLDITENDIKKLRRSNIVQKWLKRISDARKIEEKWRTDAKEAISIFECDNTDMVPYNILYANTQILSSSVYNRPPKPIVKRKHNDRDLIAKMSSEVVKRMLTYFIDDSDPTYPSIDTLMQSAVIEGLVPGRGCTKVKYDAEIEGEDENSEVKYETICGEEIPWDRLVHGYGKKWCDVPWIAIIHYMTKDEVEDLLEDNENSEDILSSIQFTYEDEALKQEKESSNSNDTNAQLARVYEIWDKTDKKVLWIASGYDKAPIKELDDELKLTGFFNIPEPLRFFKRISGLTPQILYKSYKNQAKELNRITRRINAIIEQLKYRGAYDSSIEDLSRIQTLEDGEFTPAKNIANLDGKKLADALFAMPLSELITVLQQLYVNREQIKSVIFEISGIADIMRGNTAASETLGAQTLKSQWGSMRLRDMQKEVARYCRDYLRLMAELGITKLNQDTIQAITNLQYPTNQDRMGMQQQLAGMQQQLMVLQMQQLPPEQVQPQIDSISQQMQELQSQIAIPTWEEILDLLRNDLLRNYRIDIETNSTIESDASDEKQDVAEFMGGFSQLMNGFSPLVEKGILPFEAAKAMMLAVTRKYTFGEEVEEQLDKMQAPPPPTNPEAEANAQKSQLEAQKLQQEMEYAKQEQELKVQAAQMDIAMKQQKMAIEKEKADYDAIQSRQEHTNRMLELGRKADLDTAKFNQSIRKMGLQAEVEEVQARNAMRKANRMDNKE